MISPCRITSIVAHIDHGKTTLVDSLISSDGFISQSLAGDLRYLDNRADEQERKITLKLSPIRLSNGHFFIDTPGHVDFESLIYSSSMLCNSHLILIDANEGITPRTYNLIKYINTERAVLVLNKIDLCDSSDSIQLVIHQINGLLGKEIFAWEANNVIISAAFLCTGISFSTNTFGTKNSLKTAFRAFQMLMVKYDTDDLSQIMDKYQIKYKSKKAIFQKVMPLYKAIFAALDTLYSTKTADNLQLRADGITTPFYSVHYSSIPDTLAITNYCIFKPNSTISMENVLFVTNIISSSTIKTGEWVYCITEDGAERVEIESLYEFDIDRIVEKAEISGPALVCLRGKFKKNSFICSEKIEFKMQHLPVPFYKAVITLDSLQYIEGLKSTIKTLSFVEQCFRCRLTRYGEFEIKCCGHVQFEKICTDLASAGYSFNIKTPRLNFREYVTEERETSYSDEKCSISLKIGPSDLLSDGTMQNSEIKVIRKEGTGNVFAISSVENSGTIESVLEAFTASGPLIRENICNTYFQVTASNDTPESLFKILKDGFEELYKNASPKICPKLLGLKILSEKKYVGAIYTVLQKYAATDVSEDFDEDTEFTVIFCKVPQFLLQDAVLEIRIKSKGSAYLEVHEAGYKKYGEFSEHIQRICQEKGIYTNYQIVADPEKQRTLRR
ncbi:hypothetical protein ENBRE01_0823 [Enteropsectra breve]|nr:hypothetical protein ENBRE01_0823 [Enteropsectra breve]